MIDHVQSCLILGTYMATRPCLISVSRRRLKISLSPSRVYPTGSQNPTGACTPSSSSKALRGESVYKDQSPQGGACQTILLRKKACLIQETHIFMSDILRPFHVRYDYITLYEKNKRITYDKLRSTLLDSWCNQHKYTWIVHIAAPCTMDLFDNLNVRNNPIQTRAQLFAWSPKSSSWKNIPMIAIIASNAATASCFNIGWGDQQKVAVWT